MVQAWKSYRTAHVVGWTVGRKTSTDSLRSLSTPGFGLAKLQYASGVTYAEEPGTPKVASPEKSGEEGAQLLEVLKQGRSVIVIRTEFREVTAAASSVLDKLALSKQAATTSSSQTATRQMGDVTVIDARGRIAFGEGVAMLRETLASLVATGSKKVVLNLKEVDYVDSSGMGEIVRSHMALRKQGGQLKLANLNKMVIELLDATAMNKVFDIESDEETAKRSFGA